MIHVEIVGEDRPDTRLLTQSAKEAVARMGIRGHVSVSSDHEQIAQHASIVGPGVFIDGVLVSTGSLLAPEDICDLIRWRHPELAAAPGQSSQPAGTLPA